VGEQSSAIGNRQSLNSLVVTESIFSMDGDARRYAKSSLSKKNTARG
jgi:7-keto-8-aminopelargonate synthetase-like enzyme